jgi:hypothetical protein
MPETSPPRGQKPDSTTSRRSRRQRKEKSKSKDVSSCNTPTAEASGLSGDTTGTGTALSGKTGLGTFEEGEDFIAFALSDLDDELEQRGTPIREWDRGKNVLDESYGKKRKSDDMERGERHGAKRQRLDSSSRQAPWVIDVDWHSCNNVPDL